MPDSSFQENNDTVDPTNTEEVRKQRQVIIGLVVGIVILLVVTITALVFLLSPGLTTAETVARIRDVFIIIMAFESLLI